MDARIRPAGAGDASGIAAVQVETWRQAYAGIVPASFLASMGAAERAAVWTRRLVELDPGEAGVFVAEAGGEVVGFSFAGRWRDDDADDPLTGELWAIYVRPRAQGQGIGRALLDAALAWLVEVGYVHATLWVLTDNQPARAFYEHCGWHPDGAERLVEAGRPIPEVRYRRRLDVPSAITS